MARGGDPGFRVIASLNDKFTAPIKGINNQIAQSTAKLRGLSQIPTKLGGATGVFGKLGGIFSNLGGVVGKIQGSFRSIGSAVSGLLRPFSGLASVMGGIGIGKFITDTVQAGSELIRLKELTGVAVEELQIFRRVAQNAGVSAEEMDQAFANLNRVRREVIQGTKGGKQAAEMFKALGISIADVKRLDPGELMKRIADRTSRMRLETNKQAVASTLLRDRNGRLVPVLNQSAAAIDAVADAMRANNTLMDDATAHSAREFDNTMQSLGQHMKGVGLTIVKELLPFLKDGASGMNEWFAANQKWVTYIVGGTGLLVAIGLVTKAVAVLSAALWANPILLIAGAIAAAGYLIYKNWDWIKKQWTGVQGWFEGMWKDTFAPMLGEQTSKEIETVFTSPIASIKKGWKGVTKEIEDAWSDTKAAFWGDTEAQQRVLEFFIGPTADIEAAWDKTKTYFGRLGSDIAGALEGDPEATNRIIELLIGPIDEIEAAWDAIGEYFGGLWRDIVGAWEGDPEAVQRIVDAICAPIQWVKERWEGLINWLKGAWDRIKSIFKTAEVGALPELGGAGAVPSSAQAIASGVVPAAAAPVEGGGSWWSRNNPFAKRAAEGPAAAAMAQQQTSTSEVTIDIKGLPPGSTVTQGRTTGNTDLTVNTAYTGELVGAH